MKTSDLLTLGIVAGVGYYLYQQSKKLGGAVDSAANAIAQPIANWYVDITGAPIPVPKGSVIMPDGSTLPAAQFQGNVPSGGAAPVFSVGNSPLTYNLTPNGDGTYTASEVGF